MEVKKILHKLLKWFGWSIVIVLLHIAVVLNIADHYNESSRKIGDYIMASSSEEPPNKEQAKSRSIYGSIAIVVFGYIVVAIAWLIYILWKCMKRKPPQSVARSDLKNYIIPMERDSTEITSV